MPPNVEPWIYILCMVSAALIIGISKAGFGGGIGIVAVPVMAMAFPGDPLLMLGVMLPMLIAGDILAYLHYLRKQEWRILRWLLLGAAIGIAIGTAVFLLLRRTDPAFLQRTLTAAIGIICLIFVGIQVYSFTGRRVPTLPPRRESSIGVGVLSGFVSTLAHSAGPITTIYLLQERIEKTRLVGTLVLFFLIVNVAKVPIYTSMAIITPTTLKHGLWFFPLIPLGTLAGAWMNRKLAPRPFVIIMYTAAAITAAKMVYDALFF